MLAADPWNGALWNGSASFVYGTTTSIVSQNLSSSTSGNFSYMSSTMRYEIYMPYVMQQVCLTALRNCGLPKTMKSKSTYHKQVYCLTLWSYLSMETTINVSFVLVCLEFCLTAMETEDAQRLKRNVPTCN